MYETLQKYFGYSSFLPLQEGIIRDILDKNDVFVLMPTGAGKSLCYQLPPILLGGTAVVISPLIALMKDQVDSLRANGIPAACINSAMSSQEIQEARRRLLQNEVRILYVTPERVAQPEFSSFLRQLNVALIAIDEAHCVSEWGHDFRPEYRQLSSLKSVFPAVPVAALTATAVPRVQQDIITQLQLSNPCIHKGSFDRKNLFYQVRPKDNAYPELIRYLRDHSRDSGIIYCHSRKGTEELAANLQSQGFRALSYHAGMEPEQRTDTQERFIKDDVEIIVATIAFGMGINKPNVRFVIHYDLPKNPESYYQETGRAGRDGLKSDCILFFSYGDKAKIEYFIEQKESPEQRQIARRQLREIIDFCESRACRRKTLLNYFGEDYQETNCGNCDTCVESRETIDGTVIAQKALSCVYRVEEGFGINYVVDVLCGSKSQQVLRNKHDTLSTYGIGKEYSKKQWYAFMRELLQLGYLDLEGSQYPIVKLTPKAHEVLQSKETVLLTKPAIKTRLTQWSGVEAFGSDLFELLRALRKRLADEEGMPPYVIFHDSTLKAMATALPHDLPSLMRISGVGQSKASKYGEIFLREISAYRVQHQPKQPVMKTSTLAETLHLYGQGLTLEGIARKRDLAASTIASHIEKLIFSGEDIAIDRFVDSRRQEIIRKAIVNQASGSLTPIKEELGEDYSYEEIRLVRAAMNSQIQRIQEVTQSGGEWPMTV